MIDRDKFFDAVRDAPFNGNLTQPQVDGLNFLIETWENYFPDSDIRWFAYCLATAFHETAQTMEPIEEYGKGSGKSYGEPVPPFGNCYYGRGYVQLTWLDNYEKGEQILREDYELECPMVRYPHRMLEHIPAALILFDGSIRGWFTGLGLPDFFNNTKEDAYNARKVINGLDQASTIEGYYHNFKDALQ